MKKLLTIVTILFGMSQVQGAVIKDSTTNLVLKTRVENGKISLHKCKQELNEDTYTTEVICLDRRIGGMALDMDELVERLEEVEKNNKYRDYTKITLTIVPSILLGKKIYNSSHGIRGITGLIFSYGMGTAIAGSAGYGLAKLFTDVIFGSNIDEKLNYEEAIIELDSNITVEEFISDISDALL